jgi:hypothetical protein
MVELVAEEEGTPTDSVLDNVVFREGGTTQIPLDMAARTREVNKCSNREDLAGTKTKEAP